MTSDFIWMDGELVPFEKATVHFMNPSLHYGGAVFEGIRCYSTADGPAIFRAREHAQRLLDSALIFGMRELPWTVDGLTQAFKDVVRANKFDECYVRPLIYLASGVLSLNIDDSKPTLGIAAWPWANYLGPEAMEKGIRANISSFTRHHPNVMMSKAKISGNYANSFLAKAESLRMGFQEAIMLDPQGYVAECTGENLFIVRGGRIYTSHTAAILEGITRDSLIAIARDLGYEVVEQPISRDQLYIADEVFVCGSAAEVAALSEIDFRTIGSGKMGPVTRQVQQAYHAAIHGRHPLSADWLDYVYGPAQPARETASAQAAG
ncbi:MAG: branched-chain amino acid transaminase [Chloroflexota bacterium]